MLLSSFVPFGIWLTYISFITAYHIEPYQIALCETNFLSNRWCKKYQYGCLLMLLSSFVQFGIWLTYISFIKAYHTEPWRIALCQANFLSNNWWGKKYQYGCLLMPLSFFVQFSIWLTHIFPSQPTTLSSTESPSVKPTSSLTDEVRNTNIIV